jgi:hypothetical protein
MRVKMRTQYASARCAVPPGAIVDVPEEEGRALTEGKFAELVEAAVEPVAEAGTEPSPETATAGPAEQATSRPRGWRRGR